MDFNLTPEQEALRDSVTRFAERDYGWEQRHEIVRTTAGWSAEHWTAFAELGWLGAGLSEAQGGYGGGAAEDAIILEAFGKALVVEPIVPHIVAARLLAEADAAIAAPLIEEMLAGTKRIVLAHGEATLAAPGADGLRRLTGEAAVVLGGGDADQLLVTALDAEGVLHICLVGRADVSVEDYRLVDNHRAADLRFDLTIAPDQIVPFPGGAAAAVELAEDRGIVALCAEAVGAMDAAVWLTRDYLLTRKQFGVPLAGFQALQHKMADMLIATEMARSIVLAAVAAVDQDDIVTRRRAVSAAKALIGTSGLEAVGAAIQLHGGIGMTEEYVVGHYYKRLFAIARLLGDSDAHLARFAAASEQAN